MCQVWTKLPENEKGSNILLTVLAAAKSSDLMSAAMTSLQFV